jgi:hypothetical protein
VSSGDESLLIRDVGFRHAELLGNDLFDSCFDIAHELLQERFAENSPAFYGL